MAALLVLLLFLADGVEAFSTRLPTRLPRHHLPPRLLRASYDAPVVVGSPCAFPAARCATPQMLRTSYDVIVVGGGPVGITAALRAASLGRTAIVIDATPASQFQFTGPTGLYSKALRDAALRIDVKVLRKMGICDAACWAQISQLVESIRMKAGDGNAGALALARIPHLRGRGVLESPSAEGNRLRVQFSQQRSQLIAGTNVMLATGSKAVRFAHLGDVYTQKVVHPPFPPELRVFDSDSIKTLGFLPRTVTIVGGGIIAVEYARIFAALDAKVTMVVRASDLPGSLARVGIDRDLAAALQRDLQACTLSPSSPPPAPLARRAPFSLHPCPSSLLPSSGVQVNGIRILFDTEVSAVHLPSAAECRSRSRSKGVAKRLPVRVELQRTGTSETLGRRPINTDILLTATGRRAVSDGLGLEAAGMSLAKNGDILVDSMLRTSMRNVYAAGDVVGAPQLASTGISQAEAAVDAMFNIAVSKGASPKAFLSDATRYPVGIWTIPEVAFVGLTASAAREPPHNLDVIEGRGRYSDSIRGHVHSVGTPSEGEYLSPTGGLRQGSTDVTGMALKLVVEREAPHRVVGVHVFGTDACELVHFGTTLVQERKALGDILNVCFAAVTYHELFKLAALDALANMQKDNWRKLHGALASLSDVSAVVEHLEGLGVQEEAARNVAKALMVNDTVSPVETFVKRVMRVQGPLNVKLA